MVPSGDPTRGTVKELGELLAEGDVIVDGGNSRWTDDLADAELLARRASATSTAGSPAASGAWRTATP